MLEIFSELCTAHFSGRNWCRGELNCQVKPDCVYNFISRWTLLIFQSYKACLCIITLSLPMLHINAIIVVSWMLEILIGAAEIILFFLLNQLQVQVPWPWRWGCGMAGVQWGVHGWALWKRAVYICFRLLSSEGYGCPDGSCCWQPFWPC